VRVKIAFFVNDVTTEEPKYTTTRLAMKAAERGDEVWYVGTDDLAYDPDESIRARARRAKAVTSMDLEQFLSGVVDEGNEPERIDLSGMDVLFLRNDPGEDPEQPLWTKTVGPIFGELLARRGVLVVNDPMGLSKALNKLYFQGFPEEIRPSTLVTRDRDEVQRFLDKHGGRAVMKPLQGSGGLNVFAVTPDEAANVQQMFDAIARDGYVVVQEYLEAAEGGDVRIFVMDGSPLKVGDSYAAFRRARTTDDFRSNVSVGAEAEAVEVDETMLCIVEKCRTKLVEDGMFLVGLDLAGDKVLEVNVFSPGGLGSAQRVTGADFTGPVLDSLDRKVGIHQKDGRLTNRELATM
jgi:glutathione synthase